MPGGFHPFHAGHFALYQSAKKAFPNADLYVAATNDQSERPFPFALKEKLAKLAGVDPGRFIQVKSPFQAKEITQNYDPESDVLVFVRSEKDRSEPPKPGGTKKDGSPAYFQPYTGKDLKPFSQHAYMAYLPTVEFGPGITSATQIRKAWPTLNDKRKLALVMSLYPAAQKNPKLAQTVVGMFDQVMGGQLNEFAPGNGDDGLPYAEYVVYQCDPKDQFDFIGGPLYQTDNLGMAHKYAYEMFLKHRPKAFMIYQPHIESSRGNYGVKGESDEEKLDEGLGDYITKKIDDFLDTPKVSSQEISRLMKQAPSNLPDDVAEKLVAKFMETEKAKRLAQQAADANKTTVEKIVPYLTYFGRAFVDRWKQIPQRDRDNALKNLVHNIGRFLLFILEVLAKGLMKKEGVEESKSKAIANTVKDLKNPPEIMKRRAMRDQEREETYKNAQLGRDDLDSEEDVELQQLMRKAQQHYPNMPNKQQAFIKFVQRALKHSEEEDTQQDKEIADLKQEVDKLKQDHKKIMKVSESLDYIEEK